MHISASLLYIDPGTGSMLFSLLIGLAAVVSFGFHAACLKFKFLLGLGKKTERIKDSVKSIPFLIFSDNKCYWNVFRGICDEFESNETDLVYYTASPDDPVLKAGYKYIHAEYLGEGNRPYARLNLVHADIVISTTPGLGVYQWKRSPYVKRYVHIPHTIDDLSGYRMFALDHYDAVLVSGKNQIEEIREIESKRNIVKKEIYETGSTYLDELLKKYEQSEIHEKNRKKIVLVAPTWGKSGILTKFGEEFFNGLSATNYQIVVRPHPQSLIVEKKLLEEFQEKYPSIKWNFDNDNFEILHESDILISDFSGIVFDYALIFNKPVIFTETNFDNSPYDAAWLDGKRWTLKVLPQIGKKLTKENFTDMQSFIDSALDDSVLQETREEVRQYAWLNPSMAKKFCFKFLIEQYNELRKG